MILSMLTWSSSLEGKISSTKQKLALIPGDVELLYENKQFGLETPESSLQAYYFVAGST